MTKNKRILVTGAGGYIGSLLCNKIIKLGYPLTLLDTNVYNNSGLSNVIKHTGITIFEGDIRDVNIISRSVDGIDTIIHLAGISDGRIGKANPALTKEVNYNTLNNIIETSKMSGVKRFLFASTFGVYGNSYQQKLDESLEVNPADIYSETKALGETLLVNSNSTSFTTASLRIAMVYGLSPTMRYDFLVNQLSQIAKSKGELEIYGGLQKRPQIHIQDITNIFIKMISIDEDLISGESFNAVGENPTILEISEIIKSYLPHTKVNIFPPRVNEVSFEMDGKKLSEKIGIRPSFFIKDGVFEILNHS